MNSIIDLFFVPFLIFCLYQPVLVKTSGLVCLYSLELAILVVPENMIYQAFGTILISHLPDMGNFL